MPKTDITVTTPLESEDTFTSAAIAVPKAIQYDLRADITLDTGTPVGDIVLKVVSVDTNDYLPLDGSIRIVTIPVSELSSGGTVHFAAGIDRIAAISSAKVIVENNCGVDITAATIKFAYVNGNVTK